MLILFFTIIFTAEIIIAVWLISKIRNYDKIICKINSKISPVKELIKDKIILEKQALSSFKVKVKNLNGFVEKKKTDYLKIPPQLITTIASFILKNEWKKVVLIFDIIFGIKKLLTK